MNQSTQTLANVTCVVLNYRGWQDTLACVQSLLLQDYAALTILVVDNCSPDDSYAQLQAALPSQVQLLLAPTNGGFASGNNLAVRQALAAGADYLWLLNNDTLAPPETLTRLLAASAAAATATHKPLTGTVLTSMTQPGVINAWGGGSFSLSTGYNNHQRSAFALGPTSFFSFASVLIPAEVFRAIGLLDQGFFMYYEDADFCMRARAAGFPFTVASDTAVQHKEGGSRQQTPSEFMTRTVTESGLRLLARHGRPPALAQVLFVLSRLARRLLRLDFAGVRAVLAGAMSKRKQPASPIF